MILDFNLPAAVFSQQIKDLKNTAKRLSNLSLFESQSERDLFISDCELLVLQLQWDSIVGGCYHKVDNSYRLSLIHNVLLADLLLFIGGAFFSGNCHFLGKLTLNRTIELLYNRDKKLLSTELAFDSSEAPFVIQGDRLIKQLTTLELNLLASLIGCDNIEKNHRYWVTYRSNLKDAALQSEIHYKQAIILEQTLRTSLETLTNDQNFKLSGVYDLRSNAIALSVLIQSFIWNKNASCEMTCDSLARSLTEHLMADPKAQSADADTSETIDICYSLLDYAQIDFDSDRLSLISKRLQSLPVETIRKNQIAFNKALFILKQLNNWLEYKVADHFSESEFRLDTQDSIEVIILSGSIIQQQVQKETLLSKYNNELKIYQPDLAR